MASKFEIELKKELEKVASLNRISKRDLDSMGRLLVTQMKETIAGGVSPITGQRFPKYKNPRKYPGNRKPKSPVNLKLSGEFLKNLLFRSRKGSNPSVTVYIRGRENQKKEEGHRDGANGQPKRPIIPEGREDFSRKISIAFLKKFQEILDNTYRD